MIDLHSHILPSVDDGASDLAESLTMLTIAAADGIGTIVSTPHHAGVGGGSPLAEACLALLRAIARERRLGVEIWGGYEVSLTPGLARAGADARALGINGGHYLLVELPSALWPPFVPAALFDLQSAGIRPIVSHAERYDVILRNPAAAADLVRRGALLQVNGDSLLGMRGRHVQRSARTLLACGLVSFLASDAHRASARPPRLRAATAAAARLIGESAAEALVVANPAAVIADVDLPSPPVRRCRWPLLRWWALGQLPAARWQRRRPS